MRPYKNQAAAKKKIKAGDYIYWREGKTPYEDSGEVISVTDGKITVMIDVYTGRTWEYDFDDIVLLNGDQPDESDSNIEKRTANMIIGPAGGNAGKSSRTYKLSVPSKWAKKMGISENDRAVELTFSNGIIIVKKKKAGAEK